MERNATRWVRGRPIGAGAHAAVHLAVDDSDGRRRVFAVKSVSLTSAPLASIHSLENEIRILKSLRSPYVVSYLGDDAGGDRRNLHLELMRGGTAADAAMAGALDEPRARDLVRRVALALRYLHDVAGVVHCDVKGRNVLLGPGGTSAKLADFGVALRTNGGSSGGHGWGRGTPLWMAPEVARGERPTPKADVWSLGCTVIEIMTGGKHPWSNFSNKDALGAILGIGYGEGTPELPAELSEVCRDFVARCLTRNASERWTAEQLLRHPFLENQSIKTEPSPRSVLEWTHFSSSDDDDEYSFSDEDDDSIKNIKISTGDEAAETMAGARERMRELGLQGEDLGWRSEGWYLVRSSNSSEEEIGRDCPTRKQSCYVCDCSHFCHICCCCSCSGCESGWLLTEFFVLGFSLLFCFAVT
ncbi:mitogen-activated protein kinase kinase kinase 18-like [Curcuma longa]|uniref:mitogen-activated protein kinase kinase kinase 18-like n=1 Tax=Curcuma longa TaxID=136217 RepID=UPI003D9E27DA